MSMKITNELNLPQPIVEAIRNDDYDRGAADYSVTQLLDPPRKVALTRQHADEITEDASELIYALIGKAVHTILEGASTNEHDETRLFMEIDGITVSGKPDRFVLEDGHLADYKIASVWEYIYGTRPEREQQLNIYAHLLRENGYSVESLENVLIFRDWSKRKATYEADYPSHQIARVQQSLWDPSECERFLRLRIEAHERAKVELPDCTPEERWAKDSKWAVMKPGRKSALRVLDSEEAAEAWKDTNAPASAYIDHRPGESVRCASYCKASPWCEQWAAIQRGEHEPEEVTA